MRSHCLRAAAPEKSLEGLHAVQITVAVHSAVCTRVIIIIRIIEWFSVMRRGEGARRRARFKVKYVAVDVLAGAFVFNKILSLSRETVFRGRA